jgi:hypothetical protein
LWAREQKVLLKSDGLALGSPVKGRFVYPFTEIKTLHFGSCQLHLGFYNAKYGNLSNAATKTDGLMAIGVFLRKVIYS